jgi:WD40 repeat protein
MISASAASSKNSLVIIWDLEEGTRVTTLKPHKGQLLSLNFNWNSTAIITAGLDVMNRVQLIIWDLKALLSQSGLVTGDSPSFIGIIARQVSEVPIAQVRFTPFSENDVISCGRENIRLWRVKSQHLSGRPVLLNQYSRGHSFTEVAFDLQQCDAKNSNPQFVYASSSTGIVLKFHYKTSQVLCAFQLHSSSIISFGIWNGFAVTGGADSRLRIWPLTFTDFLLEARHEGPISSIYSYGSKLAVGTTAGTLGILDVTTHRLVLRSRYF